MSPVRTIESYPEFVCAAESEAGIGRAIDSDVFCLYASSCICPKLTELKICVDRSIVVNCRTRITLNNEFNTMRII